MPAYFNVRWFDGPPVSYPSFTTGHFFVTVTLNGSDTQRTPQRAASEGSRAHATRDSSLAMRAQMRFGRLIMCCALETQAVRPVQNDSNKKCPVVTSELPSIRESNSALPPMERSTDRKWIRQTMTNSPFDQQITFLYTRDLMTIARFYEDVLGLVLEIQRFEEGIA